MFKSSYISATNGIYTNLSSSNLSANKLNGYSVTNRYVSDIRGTSVYGWFIAEMDVTTAWKTQMCTFDYTITRNWASPAAAHCVGKGFIMGRMGETVDNKNLTCQGKLSNDFSESNITPYIKVYSATNNKLRYYITFTSDLMTSYNYCGFAYRPLYEHIDGNGLTYKCSAITTISSFTEGGYIIMASYPATKNS